MLIRSLEITNCSEFNFIRVFRLWKFNAESDVDRRLASASAKLSSENPLVACVGMNDEDNEFLDPKSATLKELSDLLDVPLLITLLLFT